MISGPNFSTQIHAAQYQSGHPSKQVDMTDVDLPLNTKKCPKNVTKYCQMFRVNVAINKFCKFLQQELNN
jgi:hypothetical protein